MFQTAQSKIFLRVLFCTAMLCCVVATRLSAQEPESFDVWPDKVPGLADGKVGKTVEVAGNIVAGNIVAGNKAAGNKVAGNQATGNQATGNIVEIDEKIGQRVTKVTMPSLTVYRPKNKQSNAAVIICPGGGYRILALDLEGTEVAEWLNEIGITAIVLQYRVPQTDKVDRKLALMDAQRSISLVRSRAKELDVDPAKIGIMGFSAGGHLAANAATNFATRSYEAVDDIDKENCRPDFFMLVYPAYLVKKNRAGKPTVELEDTLPISDRTPPALMIHAADDRVTCNSSIAMFLALKRAGVPSELHIYPKGGHGYGLRRTKFAVTSWPDRAETWLRGIGALTQE